MYRVLIADDEEVVREGIKSKIKWEELGFLCAGSAEDGREAMELSDELSPHVVITDIYMPFVSGLELAEYLYLNHPDTKIVILSGFDEFDFAVKALKYRVADYILKPVTSVELTELLIKIRRELDAENDKRKEALNIKTLLEENAPVIKERFLNRLIRGEVRESELIKKLDFIGLPRRADSYAIALIDVDGEPESANEVFMEYGGELMSFSVYNVSEELTAGLSVNGSPAGVAFQNALSQTVIVFWGENAQDNCDYICKKIVDLMPRALGFTVTIGISGIFSDILEIARHYDEARSALERRFIMGNNRIIKMDGVSLAGGIKSFFDSEEHEERIISAVKSEKKENVVSHIGALFNGLKASGITIEGCMAVIQRLLLKIQLLIMRLDIEPSDVFGTETTTDLYRYKTLDEAKSCLTALCLRANAYLRSRRESYSKNLALKAVEYIRENYQNPEISIDSVSKHLSISPSYFSSIYKAGTGETFIESITKARLTKAKQLLKTTNLKAYEISNKVGYIDSHYFSILFKKHTGKTPTAYREEE